MILFTQDNTEGYSDASLDGLNAELDKMLEGIEPSSLAFWDAGSAFADFVSRETLKCPYGRDKT